MSFNQIESEVAYPHAMFSPFKREERAQQSGVDQINHSESVSVRYSLFNFRTTWL